MGKEKIEESMRKRCWKMENERKVRGNYGKKMRNEQNRNK